LLVDALIDALVANKTAGSEASLSETVRTKLGSDALSRWFPEGLRVADQRTREREALKEAEPQ
jgi:hypothetical protein